MCHFSHSIARVDLLVATSRLVDRFRPFYLQDIRFDSTRNDNTKYSIVEVRLKITSTGVLQVHYI
jgi:hypothetical protein